MSMLTDLQFRDSSCVQQIASLLFCEKEGLLLHIADDRDLGFCCLLKPHPIVSPKGSSDPVTLVWVARQSTHYWLRSTLPRGYAVISQLPFLGSSDRRQSFFWCGEFGHES